MNFELFFSIASSLAMIGWLILLLLPRRWRWLNWIPSLVIPAILSIGYILLISRYFFFTEGGFDTLANVQLLFTSPALALAGWVHFLAFDLLIGAYIAKKSDQLGLSRLIQAPILLSTFMFGPFGYLLFLITKSITQSIKNKSVTAS